MIPSSTENAIQPRSDTWKQGINESGNCEKIDRPAGNLTLDLATAPRAFARISWTLNSTCCQVLGTPNWCVCQAKMQDIQPKKKKKKKKKKKIPIHRSKIHSRDEYIFLTPIYWDHVWIQTSQGVSQSALESRHSSSAQNSAFFTSCAKIESRQLHSYVGVCSGDDGAINDIFSL